MASINLTVTLAVCSLLALCFLSSAHEVENDINSDVPTTPFPFTFPPLPPLPTFPPLPPILQPQGLKQEVIDADCLACICQSSPGNCNVDAGCQNATGFCGPYQLSKGFYDQECPGFIAGNVINISIPFVGSSVANFQGCASDKTCSERCISRYMTRNGFSCLRNYTPTCHIFQRRPFGGPAQACNSQLAQSFWNDVSVCYDLRKGVTRSSNNTKGSVAPPTNPPTLAPKVRPGDVFPSFLNDLVNRKCLDCLCKAESNCNEDIGCQGSYCGPYQISWNYYVDCQVDGGGFAQCAGDKACAERCVQRYMARHTGQCLDVPDTSLKDNATCQDFVRIHRGGPSGCRLPSTVDYWQNKVQGCFSNADKTAASFGGLEGILFALVTLALICHMSRS